MISLVSFFVLGVIGWVIYKIYIWPTYISPLRKIPGLPSENLFYGNIKTLLSEEDPQFELMKKYGNIVKYHGYFNKPMLFVTDTKIIQDIAISHVYDYIKPPIVFNDIISFAGRGLAFTEGEDHKKQRKMMNPSFIHHNIKAMVPTFIQVASTLKDLIEDKVNLGESKINLSTYLSKATLDVIGLVGFNYGFNSLKSLSELEQAYSTLIFPQNHLYFTISRLSNHIPFIRNIPIDINRKFKNACAVVERESKNLIKEKYKEAENGELKGNDVLSLLINANEKLPIEEKLTDEELKYQIMTLLLAGHETTSVAISWALCSLAEHPHMQDLLREELVKAFPDKSKFNPTFDEINSLEYLNCVIKETLRLYPPAKTIDRANLIDKVFGKYLIPKNTTISIPVSVVHKLPEIWGPTAADFDPKRWLDPSLTKNVSNLNYIPFFTGARGCIGNKLALVEMKILLSTLIRNLVFQPIEGFHLKRRSYISTRPNPYIKLSVSRVES